MEWIEGLPTEPGDYWFYRVRPGYKSLSRVVQGRSALTGDGSLMYIADDFLWERDFNGSTSRVWHMVLTLPKPPEFDRTCPTCKGQNPKWKRCFDCSDTGEI